MTMTDRAETPELDLLEDALRKIDRTLTQNFSARYVLPFGKKTKVAFFSPFFSPIFSQMCGKFLRNLDKFSQNL